MENKREEKPISFDKIIPIRTVLLFLSLSLFLIYCHSVFLYELFLHSCNHGVCLGSFFFFKKQLTETLLHVPTQSS